MKTEVNVAFSLISLNLSYLGDTLRYADNRKKTEAEISQAMEVALMSVLFGASNAVACYENGSTETGTSWADLREPVTAAVERFSRAHMQLDEQLKDCRRLRAPPADILPTDKPKATEEAAEL
jgi:hypothetical protein